MLGGPLKSSGRVISLKKARLAPGVNGPAFHRFFKKISRYAIPVDLALKLSGDSFFKIICHRSGFKRLNDLGNFMKEGGEFFYIGKGGKKTALWIYDRYLRVGKADVLIPIILADRESRDIQNRFGKVRILFEGEEVDLPETSITGYISKLEKDFQLLRIADLMYDIDDGVALVAIKVLSAHEHYPFIKERLNEAAQDFYGMSRMPANFEPMVGPMVQLSLDLGGGPFPGKV